MNRNEISKGAQFALSRIPNLRERIIALLGDNNLENDLRIQTETLMQLINDAEPIFVKFALREPIDDKDRKIIARANFFIGDVQDSTV